MFYSGSVSPPREPSRKKRMTSRGRPAAATSEEMTGEDSSSSSMAGGSSSTMAGGVRESSLMWPMLTRSNYSERVMLMQCNFEAMEIWEAIEPGGAGVKRSQDRQAMGALLRSVPREMWATLGSKKTVKEAWGP